MLKKNRLTSFFKTISKTTLVKVSGMAVGVLLSIFIGRLLGAEGLGIINLSNQLAGILTMIVLLGLPTVILKETAIAVSNKNWAHINNVIFTSLKINLPLAAIVIIISYLIIPFVTKKFFEPSLEIPLTIITIAVIFQVVSRIFASGLNGYNKIWQSSLVGDTLSIILVGLFILFQFILNWSITLISIALSYALARLVVSVGVILYWKKVHVLKEKPIKEFIPKTLLRVGLPLLFVQATNTIASNIDSIMIGSFLSVKEVGLYAVAFKIAFMSSFFLMVTNAVLAPKVATLFANKEIKKLEKIVQKVTGIMILIGVVLFLLIVFGGKYILPIWGNEFTEGYYPLIILSIGQFFNIAAGCVGLILTLCNEEKKWGYVTLGSAILNSILNIIFIQVWGITGAAIATTTTMMMVNILGVFIVKKSIGIYTIPITKIFNSL